MGIRMKTQRRRLPRTPAVLSGLTLAAVLNTAGCFGGDDSASPQSNPQSSPTTPTAPAGAPPDVEISTVSGRLTKAESAKAVTDIGAAVLHWFDGAYLAGDYPREAFGTAFGSFSTGAAEKARHDGLLSNWAVGAKIDAVVADAQRVRLDVLAVDHKVVGATARIDLVFTTEGSFAKTVTVSGKVFLTPGDKGGWRIFGYDITRGEK